MKLNWPDTFSVVEMTDAVNKLPLMPLCFGGMFETTGIPTTHMAFDYKRGRINLIPDSPRGSNPEYVTGKGGKRQVKVLSCTHLSQADTLSPEDIQDVRAFGSTEPMTVESVVNDKLSALKRNLDMTLEFHRLGAIKGIVLDADGSTVLHDIFDTFGVTQTKQDLNFPAAVEADKNPILSGIMAAQRNALQLILDYKNVRSWLDYLETASSIPCRENVAVASVSRTMMRTCFHSPKPPVVPCPVHVAGCAVVITRSVICPKR